MTKKSFWDRFQDKVLGAKPMHNDDDDFDAGTDAPEDEIETFDEEEAAPPKKEGAKGKGKKPAKEKKKSAAKLRTERLAALEKAIPPTIDGVKAAHLAAIDAFHAAMLANDTAAIEAAEEALSSARRRAHAVKEMNGTEWNRAEALKELCAAPFGEVPKWGQRGCFLLEHRGYSGWAHCTDEDDLNFLAARGDAPFLASDGAEEFYLYDGAPPGCDVPGAFRSLIDDLLDAREKGKAAPETQADALPDCWYVPSDGSAPPDKHSRAPDGLTAMVRGRLFTTEYREDARDLALRAFRMAERWEAERKAGGRVKAPEFPKAPGRDRKILAIAADGSLVPAATYPASGAYFVTEDIRLKAKRTEVTDHGHCWQTDNHDVLRYVEDASDPGVAETLRPEKEALILTPERCGATDPESKGLPYSRYANIYPMMSKKEREELHGDIRARGFRDNEPIEILDGEILDGRNRYEGAVAARLVSPDYVPDFSKGPRDGIFVLYDEEQYGDPLLYVISKNSKRRHLNEGQRSMVAAKVAGMKQGRPANKAKKPAKGKPANLQVFHEAEAKPAPAPVSRADAAEALQVSERSVASAAKVLADGAPELQQAVERGEIAVSTAEALTNLPKEEQAEIVARGKKEILEKAKEFRAERNTQKREQRLEKIRVISAGNGPLPDKRYPVILADPAWLHETWSENGKDRAPENHYPCMDIAEIQALALDRIATPDAMLALWTTVPHLVKALNLLPGWGFEYKSHLVWVKDRIGTGYWFRNQHEVLIIATRGDFPAPLMGTQMTSVLSAPAGAHSKKPDEIRVWIETIWPGLPKIELFCRDPREGWDVWGNQASPPDAEPVAEPAGEVALAGGTMRLIDAGE